jgi:small-conductance mechanosensitive channel
VRKLSLNFINFEDPVVQKLVVSIVVVIIAYIFNFWIIKLINSKMENLKWKHQTRRYTYYITTLVTILIMLFIWMKRPESLTTYLGFLSAGLALALHQVILNIVGWILIILRRPFDLGDRIEWGGTRGDVIDIQLFHTTLLEIGNWVEDDQSTGRIVNMPNSAVFKDLLFNSTHGFDYLWNELNILITFESDREKAKEIILDVANNECEKIQKEAKQKIRKMAKRYMIKYTKFSPITYIDIKDSGVQITLRYLTSVRGKRMIQSRIYENILDSFVQENNINLAYPTWRIYLD